MAGGILTTVLAGGVLTLLSQYIPGGFFTSQETTPPPGLAAFNAVTGAAPGEVALTVDFPGVLTDYNRVQIRWLAGATAPNAACTNGTVLTTYTAPFTDPSSPIHTATAGSAYSYRACVYDAWDNLTPSNGVSNVQSRPACSGTTVGGYCWYYASADYQSCNTVCASRGGYHAATQTYAGSGGTNANCAAVATAFSHSTSGSSSNCTGVPNYGTGAGGLGCCRGNTYGSGRCTGTTNATATGTQDGVQRYCACNY